MSKWDKYNSVQSWIDANHDRLRSEYEEFYEDNCKSSQPLSCVSFADFCVGKWQRLE
jgi:hypothetical protein